MEIKNTGMFSPKIIKKDQRNYYNYFTNIGPELAKKFKILLKVTL